MIKKANFHTHTNFCDGRSTAEEMVQSAISKGFDLLGFSSHCMYPFASTWHIAPRNVENYCAEILRLKEAYKDKIQIQLGFEADFIQNITAPDKKGDYKDFKPDFLIGSTHYIVKEGGNFTVDDSADNVRAGLARHYTKGGDWNTLDWRAYVHDYFEAERQMLEKGNFDIIGHADLIRMRNCSLKIFSENDDFYKEEVKLTADAIARAGVIAEINTGAIARGNMDALYPSDYFLGLLYERKVPVCINSDAHDAKNLDAAFDRAAEAAKKTGYKELSYPLAGRIEHIKL